LQALKTSHRSSQPATNRSYAQCRPTHITISNPLIGQSPPSWLPLIPSATSTRNYGKLMPFASSSFYQECPAQSYHVDCSKQTDRCLMASTKLSRTSEVIPFLHVICAMRRATVYYLSRRTYVSRSKPYATRTGGESSVWMQSASTSRTTTKKATKSRKWTRSIRKQVWSSCVWTMGSFTKLFSTCISLKNFLKLISRWHILSLLTLSTALSLQSS